MITILDLTKNTYEVKKELSDVESLWELCDILRSLSDDEDDDQTYLIELDRDELDFLKNQVEDEIVEADTVEATRMYVRLLDKIEEAEGREE